MGLLDGQVARWIEAGTRWMMLDATIYQHTDTYTPGSGNTRTTTTTVLSRVGFPDTANERYMANTTLEAGERLLVLLQRPVKDAGLTLQTDDEILMRSIRSTILDVREDPAEATFVCRVVDSGGV